MQLQAALEQVAKAAALTAKPRRVVAELPEGTFEHVRRMADNLPPEPVRRTIAEQAEITRPMFELLTETRKLRQMIFENHRRMRRTIKLGQLAWRARVSGSRSDCSGGRSRPPRGKPVRRRGSKRTTAATRAGPDDGSGDPEPGSSSGRLDRRALTGRRA